MVRVGFVMVIQTLQKEPQLKVLIRLKTKLVSLERKGDSVFRSPEVTCILNERISATKLALDDIWGTFHSRQVGSAILEQSL